MDLAPVLLQIFQFWNPNQILDGALKRETFSSLGKKEFFIPWVEIVSERDYICFFSANFVAVHKALIMRCYLHPRARKRKSTIDANTFALCFTAGPSNASPAACVTGCCTARKLKRGGCGGKREWKRERKHARTCLGLNFFEHENLWSFKSGLNSLQLGPQKVYL